MTATTVTAIRCTDYAEPGIAEAIKKQFELLGGLEKFVSRGDSVLLKPNFITPRSRRHAAQTDPSVILETARLLKDFGAKPFVGDSPAWGNLRDCIEKLKLKEPLEKLGVPAKQLNAPKKCRIGRDNTNIGISSVALDADVIINLPKFKTHQQLTVTFAVKNMFGCVTGKHKALWHFRKGENVDDFCEMLIEIYRHLNPALTIVDAVVAMDGPGPIRGRARPLGWLIAGTDPIACEIVCSQLVDIDPHTLPIVKTAAQMNFGCRDPEKIELLGDDLSDDICTDFVLPEIVPLRFSLPHVCRSICKQIIFLAKSALKKDT